MGIESALYRVILLLHIATVIVGFGGLIVQGFYNSKAYQAAAGAAVTLLDTTRSVSKLAEYAIYTVLPLGIVLVAISDNTFGMGDPWVSASFVVWFLFVGALHGAIRPALKTLAERAGALSPDTALSSDSEAQGAARKLMIGEASSQLLVVVALFLMIWKPGA